MGIPCRVGYRPAVGIPCSCGIPCRSGIYAAVWYGIGSYRRSTLPQTVTEKDMLESVNKVIKGYAKRGLDPDSGRLRLVRVMRVSQAHVACEAVRAGSLGRRLPDPRPRPRRSARVFPVSDASGPWQSLAKRTGVVCAC